MRWLLLGALVAGLTILGIATARPAKPVRSDLGAVIACQNAVQSRTGQRYVSILQPAAASVPADQIVTNTDGSLIIASWFSGDQIHKEWYTCLVYPDGRGWIVKGLYFSG